MCKDLGNNLYECNGNCAGGTVWGTGIYTSDSNIWLAAKHMGYLPGTFTKIPGPALNGFIDTTQNGVTTANYGVYGSTFYLHKGSLAIANNPQALNDQIKLLQEQVKALNNIQKELVGIIKNYEGNIKETLVKNQKKQKQLEILEQKILNDSVRSAQMNETEARMKDLYISEMKRYNQRINILTQKGTLLCSVCLQNKRQAVLIPCGHAHFCKNCVKACVQKGTCKICEVEINGYQLMKLQ